MGKEGTYIKRMKHLGEICSIALAFVETPNNKKKLWQLRKINLIFLQFKKMSTGDVQFNIKNIYCLKCTFVKSYVVCNKNKTSGLIQFL